MTSTAPRHRRGGERAFSARRLGSLLIKRHYEALRLADRRAAAVLRTRSSSACGRLRALDVKFDVSPRFQVCAPQSSRTAASTTWCAIPTSSAQRRSQAAAPACQRGAGRLRVRHPQGDAQHALGPRARHPRRARRPRQPVHHAEPDVFPAANGASASMRCSIAGGAHRYRMPQGSGVAALQAARRCAARP